MLQLKDPYTGIPLKSSYVPDKPGAVAEREAWYRKRGWLLIKTINKCGFVFLTFVEEKNKERYCSEGLLQEVTINRGRSDTDK